MELAATNNPAPCVVAEKKNRAKWHEPEVDFLVTLLVEYNKSRYRGQNGWSKEAWSIMVKRMNEKFPHANFTKEQIKDKERELKKHFKVVKWLRDQSGFGWDNVHYRVVAPPEVLLPIIEANSQAKRFYRKPLSYYDALYGLYAGAREVESYAKPASIHSETGSPMESAIPTIVPPSNLDDELLELRKREAAKRRKDMHEILAIEKPMQHDNNNNNNRASSPNYLGENAKLHGDDKYSINKCVVMLMGLSSLSREEQIKALMLFEQNSTSREMFISLAGNDIQVDWLRAKLGNL